MDKPIFELMSREEFYAVEYTGKEYTLQHTHQLNPDYFDNTIYDAETGDKVTDENTIQEILEAFGDL
jgi:hypothetical protein